MNNTDKLLRAFIEANGLSMFKKIRSFKCGSCQREYEKLVDDNVKVVECDCGKGATRMLAAPKFTGNSCGRNASFN